MAEPSSNPAQTFSDSFQQELYQQQQGSIPLAMKGSLHVSPGAGQQEHIGESAMHTQQASVRATEQGIGRFRKQHELLSNNAATADGHSGDFGTHEPAQVLRRRSSFSKPLKGGLVKSSKSFGMLSPSRLASESSGSILPMYDDSTQSVSGESLARRLLSFGMQRSSRIRPVSMTALRQDTASRDQASTIGNHKLSNVNNPQTSVKHTSVSMHNALRQSVDQVKACTLQLQEQQGQQQGMQRALQAMTTQTVAMLDKAIFAALEQQHSRVLES